MSRWYKNKKFHPRHKHTARTELPPAFPRYSSEALYSLCLPIAPLSLYLSGYKILSDPQVRQVQTLFSLLSHSHSPPAMLTISLPVCLSYRES